jgi:hypothetical protein
MLPYRFDSDLAEEEQPQPARPRKSIPLLGTVPTPPIPPQQKTAFKRGGIVLLALLLGSFFGGITGVWLGVHPQARLLPALIFH